MKNRNTAKRRPVLRILYLQVLLACICLGLFSCKKTNPGETSGESVPVTAEVSSEGASSASNLEPSSAVPTTSKLTEAPTTAKPTEVPTTAKPTEAPTTAKPTEAPTTARPSEAPTTEPTVPPTTETPKSWPDGTLRAYIKNYREKPLTSYEAELKINKEGLRSILSGVLSESALDKVLGILSDDSAAVRMTGKLPDPAVNENLRAFDGTISIKISRFGLSTNLEVFKWEFRNNRYATLDYSGLMRLLSLAFLGDEKRDAYLKEKFGDAILPYLEQPYELKADLGPDPFRNTLAAAEEVWEREEYFLLEIFDKTRYPARTFADGELTVNLNKDTLYLFIESFATWAEEQDMYRLAEERIRLDEALAEDIAAWKENDSSDMLAQLWGSFVQTEEKQSVQKTGQAWAAVLKEAKQEIQTDSAAARVVFNAFAERLGLPELEIDFFTDRIEVRGQAEQGSLSLTMRR
ncbi:MAG: hypothetical protein IK125_08680 [Lachnospiraceae bacterium]|nr:hypothetical protein [Lachnospiraceae bacterium]